MYKYQIKDYKEFEKKYKRYLNKQNLAVGIVFSLFFSLICTAIFIIVVKDNLKALLIISFLFFTIFMSTFIIFSERMKNFLVKNTFLGQCYFLLDEYGITLGCENEEMKISWESKTKIEIYDEYFIINTRVSGIHNMIIWYDDINATREEIISEINKYEKSR